MAQYTRLKAGSLCRDCKTSLAATRHGLCLDCATKRAVSSITQMTRKAGPYHDRWLIAGGAKGRPCKAPTLSTPT